MKSTTWWRLTVAVLAAAPLGRAAENDIPDTIWHGGKVLTVDAAFSVQEAIAVRDGRIVAVGRDRDILARAQPGRTTVHNLGGRTVIPGLIDSHVHAAAAAIAEHDHVVPPMESIADVLAYIRARAQVVPEGEWISLAQNFITRLRESRYPTRAELDAAAPKHPVAFHTGPDVMLSSLALQRSGIDRNFTVKDGGPGYLEKDGNGEPTGVLRGLARYVRKTPGVTRPLTDADRLSQMQALLADYNRNGITAVGERGGNAQNIALYQALRDTGRLTVRVALSHTVVPTGAWESVLQSIDQVAAHPLRQPDPWLRLIGTKVWLDGGMLTGSAYMLRPWGRSEMYGIIDDQYRGVLNIPEDRLRQMVRRVAEHGMQFTAHVQGDGAVTTLMDAYEQLNADIPVRPLRMGLTHSSFMTPDTVQRAARLGVVPDIQPIWLYLDARTLVQHFGYERLRHFQPLRSLFAAGAITGGGSDHMLKIGDLRAINPYNPFLGMWITLTRSVKWSDQILHPEESLTRQQALQFYTRNNAYLLFWDAELGSLEPGKRADFALLDRDYLTCPIDEIKDTRVLETWVEGKQVYRARP